MRIESLRDLYVEQLEGLYDVEHQLIKALPKMAEAAAAKELRTAFENHLATTREHARRIEIIFRHMGLKTQARRCEAIEGMLREGSQAIEGNIKEALRDIALIATAMRVEHYEIAGYGCVRTHATILKDDVAADLLAQTLAEEEDADKTLNAIAKRLNLEVARDGGVPEAQTLQSKSVSAA